MLEDPLASLDVRLGEASTRRGVYVGSYGSEEKLLSLSLGVLDLLFDPGCLTVDVSKVLFVELGSDLLVVELADDTFIPGSPRRVSIRSVGSRWRRSIFVVVWMTLHAPWDRWGVWLWRHRGCIDLGLSCGPCFFSLYTLGRLVRSDSIARSGPTWWSWRVSSCNSGGGRWVDGCLLGLLPILVDVDLVQIQRRWHGPPCLGSPEWIPSILSLRVAVAHDVQGTLSENGGGVDKSCLDLPCDRTIVGEGIWYQGGVD